MDLKSIDDYKARLYRRKYGNRCLRHFDEIIAIANTLASQNSMMDDKSIFKKAERIFKANCKIFDEAEREYKNTLLANVDMERASRNYEQANLAEQQAWESKLSANE